MLMCAPSMTLFLRISILYEAFSHTRNKTRVAGSGLPLSPTWESVAGQWSASPSLYRTLYEFFLLDEEIIFGKPIG
jgi:hypothetical protein